MERIRRNAIFKVLRDTEDSIMRGKGDEYSQGSEDVNRNFKVVADLLTGAPMDDLTVCAVYALKHIISLCDYVVRRPVQPPSGEGIEGRVNDARNYIGILFSLIVEHDEAAHPQIFLEGSDGG